MPDTFVVNMIYATQQEADAMATRVKELPGVMHAKSVVREGSSAIEFEYVLRRGSNTAETDVHLTALNLPRG